jgi:hypothetical protein
MRAQEIHYASVTPLVSIVGSLAPLVQVCFKTTNVTANPMALTNLSCMDYKRFEFAPPVMTQSQMSTNKKKQKQSLSTI